MPPKGYPSASTPDARSTMARRRAPTAAAVSPRVSAHAAVAMVASRRRTSPTHRPTSGPYSGPRIMAPTIKTGESVRMPQAAMRAAITMKRKNEGVDAESSRA